MEVVIAYPNPKPACCKRAGLRDIEWCRPSDDKAAKGPRNWHLVFLSGDGSYRYQPVHSCPFCGTPLTPPNLFIQVKAEIYTAVDVVSRSSTNAFETIMARHGMEPMEGEDITQFMARSLAEAGPRAVADLVSHYKIFGD